MTLNIFMNGITGQVGAFLARELLLQGHHIYALARGDNPQQRTTEILQKIGTPSHLYSQLHVLKGDIIGCLPIKPNVKIAHFVHIAASLSFAEKDNEEVTNTNINGTKNMLALCSQWQCGYFHYFSTAYIAGKHNGKFGENDIDLEQSFKNSYERSKSQAEKICRTWAKQHKDTATLKVYRPGIVMGDKQGRTVNYSGFYVFLKILNEITKNNLYKNSSLRIHALPQVIKNIVAVDYVARCVAAIIEEQSLVNETLYLLPQNPPSNQEIKDWLASIFNITTLEIIDKKLEKPTTSERMLEKGLKLYAPYMNSEPNFDSKYSQKRFASLGIKENIIDKNYFVHLVDYGKKDLWGRKKSTNTISNTHPYFTEFLPSFCGKEILPNLENVTSCFAVKIKGKEQENWKLEIQKGILITITPFTENDAVAFSYELSSTVFNQMIEAQIDPRAAFFSGKTDIHGNIEKGLKIANILRLFFARYSGWRKQEEDIIAV